MVSTRTLKQNEQDKTTMEKIYFDTRPDLPSVHGDDIVHLVRTLPGLLRMEGIIKASPVQSSNLRLQDILLVNCSPARLRLQISS